MQEQGCNRPARHKAEGGPKAAPPIFVAGGSQINRENAEPSGPSRSGDRMMVRVLSHNTDIEEDAVAKPGAVSSRRKRGQLVEGGFREAELSRDVPQVGASTRNETRGAAPMIGMTPEFPSHTDGHPARHNSGRIRRGVDAEDVWGDVRAQVGAKERREEANRKKFIANTPGQAERPGGRRRPKDAKD